MILHKKNTSPKKFVSFDNNLEVYGTCKTHLPLLKHGLRKNLTDVTIDDMKFSQKEQNSKKIHNDDQLQDKENKLTTYPVKSGETAGILIHDEPIDLSSKKIETIRDIKERATNTKTKNYYRVDKIKNSYDKLLQIKEKFGILINKKENEFNSVFDEHYKVNSGLGKTLEDVMDEEGWKILVKKAEDVPQTQTNYNSQMYDSDNKQKEHVKWFEDSKYQNIQFENKYDFLCNTAKEYAKIFSEKISAENESNHSQTTLHEPAVIEEGEELSDEETNCAAYCNTLNFRFQTQNEPNECGSFNISTSVSSQYTTKNGKNVKNDTIDKILEFRLEEAKRQSTLDKLKFKEDSARSENLIPCDIPLEKGFFSDIILFDENRKGILTETIVNHAKRTGSLQLSNKSLTEVPDIVWLLNAKEDQLVSEPSEFQNKWRHVLQTIINLNLSFNKLKLINPKASFGTIKELRLNNNKIEELPGEIGLLHFLSYLNLSYNHLRSLPLKICSLKNLEEINLRRNLLEKLPDTLGNLVNLRKLDLSFNKIVKLPASFISLNSLTFADLSFNELMQLPVRMMYLKKLETVNLSYNFLSELPPMVDLKYLMFFDLTCNKLRHFPNFSGCVHLTELRLGINQIREILIENLFGCPLVNLMLPHNKIEVIPDDISILTRLQILDISHNLILMLPWTLARLQHLTYVKIDNNKIGNVKKSALENSPQSVLEILRNRLILYEGKDSPILKQIAEKEKKDLEERKEWDVQEGNLPLSANNGRKKTSKSVEKMVEKVEEKGINKKYSQEIKNTDDLEGSIHGLLDDVLKTLPSANKVEFKKSLTAHRSLICKEMNLSDLSVNLIKVAGHYKVFKVDLSKNNFSFVPIRLRNLFSHLRDITLSNNNLKTIPDFFGSLIQLRTLDVSHNQLESFPLSMGDCNITSLNARNNCFTKISKVLYSIYSLEHVNFSKNKIKTIDVHGVKNWKRLSYLNLRSNLIEEVPCELGFLMNIRTLDIIDNPFKDPSSQILKGGTAAILKYLRYISFKQTHSDLKNLILF